MGLIEVIISSCRICTYEIVVVVGGNLTGHHILPGIFVTAIAYKSLLVTIVDERRTTGEKHERLRQLDP